ncbi:OmpA family protein [Dongshaea marina]|uniref:OmpA family protein n=1 Tax=Dongshaea marina TaxID=2047966 RepID=UPI000D3ECBC5|nr:OmpA family protein [Dongshaea marina]
MIKRKSFARYQQPGGAWKVAFADFTLSLLCLFMVLWITNISTPQQRAAIAQKFAGHGQSMPLVQEESGLSPVQARGKINHNEPQPVSQLQLLLTKFEKIKNQLPLGKNAQLKLLPQGMKVIFKDTPGHSMFNSGSAQMNPGYEILVEKLADLVRDIPNKMMISGHTDTYKYQHGNTNNWILSVKRALDVKEILYGNGIDDKRFLQVSGFSDKAPLDSDDPYSQRNRRVEIMILTQQGQHKLMKLFDEKDGVETQGQIPAASKGTA